MSENSHRYRIESFGIKLLLPESWHYTFTLSRLPDQPPISIALQYPMSDQIDDWRDYQHLKNVDRGEDFDTLREILRDPTPQVTEELGGEEMERDDSGYFSRRSSKLSSRIGSVPDAQSRINSLSSSILEDVADVELELVAGGTPSISDSEPRTVYVADVSNALDGVQDVLQSSASDSQAAKFPDDSEDEETSPKTLCPDKKRETTILDEIPPLDESHHGWTPQWGLWPRSGLDGTEEGEFMDWAAVKKLSRQQSDQEKDAALEEIDEGISVDNSIGKTPIDTVDRGEDAARKRLFRIASE